MKSLKELYDEAKAANAALSTANSILEQRIADLDATVTSLRADLTARDAEISDLRARLAMLDTQIQNAEVPIRAVSTEVVADLVAEELATLGVPPVSVTGFASTPAPTDSGNPADEFNRLRQSDPRAATKFWRERKADIIAAMRAVNQ